MLVFGSPRAIAVRCTVRYLHSVKSGRRDWRTLTPSIGGSPVPMRALARAAIPALVRPLLLFSMQFGYGRSGLATGRRSGRLAERRLFDSMAGRKQHRRDCILERTETLLEDSGPGTDEVVLNTICYSAGSVHTLLLMASERELWKRGSH